MIQKLFLFFFLNVFLFYVTEAQTCSSIIKGNISEGYSGEIFLSKMQNTQKGIDHIMIDSAICDNGNFTICLKEIERPDIYQLYSKNRSYYTELVLSKNAIIDVGLVKFNPYNTVVKTESREQQVLDILRGASKKCLDEIIALSKAFETGQGKKKITESEYHRLVNLAKQKPIAAIKQCPNHVGSFMVLSEAVFLNEKEYIDLFESLDTTSFQYTYYFHAAKEKYLKAKEKWLVGSEAKDFTATDLNGKSFSLSGLRGKYVLLDFWASWCVPCRKKNMQIVQVLPRLRQKKIEVLSFSMDDKKVVWENASKADKISWLNLSDLMGFDKSPVREKYKLKNLPTVFLINPEGKIIAQNMTIEELLKMKLK